MARPGTAAFTKALLNARSAARGEPEALGRVLESAIEATEAARGFVVLVDAQGGQSIRVARDCHGQTLAGARTSRSLVVRAIETGETILAGNASSDLPESARELRIESVLASPLALHGRSFGAIVVHDRPFVSPGFGEPERKRLAIVTAIAAGEIGPNGPLAPVATVPSPLELPLLVGSAPCFAELKRQLAPVCRSRLSVLIEGESGTGKELIARSLHEASGRPGRFVPVNVATLGASLLESALFGHEKGAFTGADKKKRGFFEEAASGTLFLDEIGEMPLDLQPSLLRALQERSVTPVGATRETPVDVRIVAATNRSLAERVATGAFRQDLYFRLSGVTLVAPPLRDRLEDVPRLAAFFLHKHAALEGRTVPSLSPRALSALVAYAWPGNVRELENAVSRALVFGNHVLEPADFRLPPNPAPGALPKGPFAFRGPRTRIDRDTLRRTLDECGGNVAGTAAVLGFTASWVHRRVKRWGLSA